MKKFIALLCTLCIIATMVPFSAFAEGAITVHVSWSGTNAEDVLEYNGLFKEAFALVPNDGKAKEDYAYLNDGVGGKAADDYYLAFDYVNETGNTTFNYIMYGPDANQTIRKANYFAIKYNVFGDEAALTPQLRISGTVKPTLFTFDAADKLMFKAGVWNTVMIVVDTNNNKVWAYVNGLKTHVADVSNVPPQSNASYTKLNEMGIDRIMLNAQGINTSSKMLSVDDLCVAYSATEIVPSAVDVTSTGMTYGDSIIASGAISNIASAGNTAIVYNGTAATRGATTAATGNLVSVEATDAAFGKVYANFEVKSSIASEVWDGTDASNVFGYVLAGVTGDVATTPLDGKVNDSYGAFTANASGECVIYGSQSYSTRFFTISLNVYGKAINDIFPRIDGSIKPSVITGKTHGGQILPLLEDNRWNHLFFVFDSDTKDMKTYINGVLKADINLYDALEANFACTVDKNAGTATASGKTYNANLLNLKTDLRIRMANGKTSYMDDGVIILSDFEPKPYGYADVSVAGGSISDNVIKFAKDSETITVTAAGATVMVNDGTAWVQSNVVNSSTQEVAVVSTTPYGNVYSPVYAVISPDYTETIATQDTMSFVQGGYPWVTDENGENGYNVQPTGSNNKVLIKDAENVWGSEMDMKELAVGYNFKNSTQTYYETSWKKSELEKKCSYLVLEADIAFPAEDYVSGFGMSTSGGTTISSRVPFNSDVAHRVNHYMWVYDIAEGKYVDYLNGVAMVAEPVAVNEKFANGTGTAIRFTANGATKMSDVQIEGEDGKMVNWYGQHTDTLNAYMGNVKVYGAASYPEVAQAPVLAGAVGRFYPIYDTSEFTLDYIKSQITGADNVTVYKNKSYSEKLENGTDKASYYYMIVAEKDGIFSYYRVCQMADADATYALETFSPNTNGGYTAMVINLGDTTDIALTFAEKTAADDFVTCKIKVAEDVPCGGEVSVVIDDVASGNSATLYVWDGYETLVPLGAPMSVIKK